jgi:hypothetical protein
MHRLRIANARFCDADAALIVFSRNKPYQGIGRLNYVKYPRTGLHDLFLLAAPEEMQSKEVDYQAAGLKRLHNDLVVVKRSGVQEGLDTKDARSYLPRNVLRRLDVSHMDVWARKQACCFHCIQSAQTQDLHPRLDELLLANCHAGHSRLERGVFLVLFV